MGKDLERAKDIDTHLSGKLSLEEHKEFEKRLREDNDLREEVNTS